MLFLWQIGLADTEQVLKTGGGDWVRKEKLHSENMGLLCDYGVSVLPGIRVFFLSPVRLLCFLLLAL